MDGVSDGVAIIEDFPRAEVDRVGREDITCRVEVDDLARLGRGRVGGGSGADACSSGS
jgi:hypothetical protein